MAKDTPAAVLSQEKIVEVVLRGRVLVTRVAHNHVYVSSNLIPATILWAIV